MRPASRPPRAPSGRPDGAPPAACPRSSRYNCGLRQDLLAGLEDGILSMGLSARTFRGSPPGGSVSVVERPLAELHQDLCTKGESRRVKNEGGGAWVCCFMSRSSRAGP